MIFSQLLKGYGPNLQNDTNLETTSCFIAKKMAFNERAFSKRKSMGSLLGDVNHTTDFLLEHPIYSLNLVGYSSAFKLCETRTNMPLICSSCKIQNNWFI